MTSNFDQGNLEDQRSERDLLIDRLADAELKLAEMPKIQVKKEQIEDLKKRLEMAIEDVRELKAKNAELENQLAQVKSQNPKYPSAQGANLDWQQVKQRLIASLESDLDPDDKLQRQEQLTVEETIRVTDLVVDEMKREIDELKQLLNQQSSAVADVAVGASAIANILDKDELILQERKELSRSRKEFHDKLCKAEIEISIERAKLARQGADIEEKLATIESERLSLEQSNQRDAQESKKPSRGRWLARLGLKNLDQE